MFVSRAFFYILKSIFSPFLVSTLAFFSLIFTFQFLQSSQLFFQDSSSYTEVLKILSLLGISYLPIIIPFCLLFGILFGHGKLSSNSEFSAFSALGLSKVKLALPAIFFSLICFTVCFLSIHNWGPNARFKSRSLENTLKKKIAVTAFQPGVFLTQIKDHVIYAEDQEAKGDLKKIFIFRRSGPRKSSQIFSQQGQFLKNNSNNLGVLLQNGSIYSHPRPLETAILSFSSYTARVFNFNENGVTRRKDISNRTSSQLRKLLKPQDHKKNEILIEIHKRHMLALSCLVFLVLSLLTSLRIHNRTSKGSGVFLALILSLSFWILLFGSEFFAVQQSQPFLLYLPLLPSLIFVFMYYRWIKLKSLI